MYSARFHALREDHDPMQEQLSPLLQIHKTTYVNYELGKCEIPFALVVRLAKLFNGSIDYIAGLSSKSKAAGIHRPPKRSLSFPVSRCANQYE